jgi:hypothetical protein
MSRDTIGKVTERVKIAAGLFWADYGILGAQVEELTSAGVDWRPCILAIPLACRNICPSLLHAGCDKDLFA